MVADDFEWLFVLFVGGVVVALVLTIRFFGALQRALNRVHPDHRRMSPPGACG